MTIVTIPELGHGLPHFFEVAEGAAMDGLPFSVRLKRSATPLVWGSATKAKLLSIPQNAILFQEVVGSVLRTVVHAQHKPLAGVGTGGAELGLEPLGNRLQGSETIADLDGMDADAAGVEMIDHREHPHPAVFNGLDADTVGAPHLVRCFSLNRAIMQHRGALPHP
ncbi:hypothetical protein, partial [Tepidimonas charontis]|uniref:hypothetical protein n=1 Tax=Tepidimonas charontis TaxID=2267262 RepID=UPI0011872C24